jgi:hypothetical protein
MNDLIYSVNKETRTTECIVQNCKRDFMRITDKVLSTYPEYIRYFYKFIAVYHCDKSIKDEYIGKTVCSEEDTFDERCGRDIARTKAIIKRESAFQSTLSAIFNDINTMLFINVETDREHILDKHLNNLDNLYEHCVSLAKIKGYAKDDEYGINDNIDLNKDYTPHCCALCGKTFLNYKDDKDYFCNENSWHPVILPNDNKLEVCSSCSDTLKTLSNG